jgi:hypothetical protein
MVYSSIIWLMVPDGAARLYDQYIANVTGDHPVSAPAELPLIEEAHTMPVGINGDPRR